MANGHVSRSIIKLTVFHFERFSYGSARERKSKLSHIYQHIYVILKMLDARPGFIKSF